MYAMTRHTFRSILRSKIFWVMLIFSVLLIAILGYSVTRAMILGAFMSEGIFDEPEDISEVAEFMSGKKGPTRKEVDELDVEFGQFACNGGAPGMGDVFKTPLIAGIQYFGFGTIIFFSNLASVFLFMGLLPRELEKRSIYTLLSKPLSRTDIFLGKLFGGWAAIFVFNFILGLMLACFMFLAGAPFKTKFLIVAAISSLSPMLFGTLALTLGTFLRTAAVSFFTVVLLFFASDPGSFLIYGIGHEILHWDGITNFVLNYLPPLAKVKALVTAFIDYNMFAAISDFAIESGTSRVFSQWWLNAVFVGLYFIGIIIIGWGIFRQKEFN